MLAAIAAVGGGAFVLAAVVVGVRLLLLAARTRGLPEFTMGLGLFIMGGLGYPVTIVAQQATGLSEATRIGLIVANQLFTIVGMTALALFNWRVFRPAETWPRVLVLGVPIVMLGFFAAQGLGPGFFAMADTASGPWNLASLVTGAVLAWGAYESSRYAGQMRRRFQVGLGDPVVTNRFVLWAMGTGCAAAITLVHLGIRYLLGEITPVLGALIVGPIGLVAAGSVWLAFLPPAAYTRWVAARGAAAA